MKYKSIRENIECKLDNIYDECKEQVIKCLENMPNERIMIDNNLPFSGTIYDFSGKTKAVSYSMIYLVDDGDLKHIRLVEKNENKIYSYDEEFNQHYINKSFIMEILRRVEIEVEFILRLANNFK